MNFSYVCIISLALATGCNSETKSSISKASEGKVDSKIDSTNPAPAVAPRGSLTEAANRADSRSQPGTTSGTRLFGVELKSAARSALQEALASKGLKPLRTQPQLDIYDGRTLLDECSELELAYASSGRFARAKYTFPSRLDAEQVVRIRNLVQQKYGPPSEERGNVQVGSAEFSWQLADGIHLSVRRGWPDTTTELEYRHPVHVAELERQLDATRAQRDHRRFERQADAL